MFALFKKYIIVILSIVLLGWLAMKPFQSFETVSENLVVGLQSGYPPFEFMDVEGKIVGFDIAIAERIAEKLKKRLIIKDMEFDGEILSLKQGKIDLIISGMNITPNRLKEISMVPYHGEAASALSLIFWNEIPEGIHSLEDIVKLSNISISVESGTTSEAFMNRYKEIHTKSFQGAFAPLMEVKYGKSTANLVEKAVAEYLKKQHPEIKIINIPLPKEEAILGFGIGVKKENQELFKQIEQIIDEFKLSGELKQLESKWFKGEE